jgi:hypothetical protein
MSQYTALSGRIHAYLRELDKVVNRAIMLGNKAIQSEDDGYWDGAALNLHSFSGGVEKIFEDIARTFDGSLPSGPDWHIGLLMQMSGDIEGRRPAIISDRLRDQLDEYRGFRHVVRNVYAFNFRPSRIKELTDNLPETYSLVKEEIHNFTHFLDQLTS